MFPYASVRENTRARVIIIIIIIIMKKKVGNTWLGESDLNPISPKASAPQTLLVQRHQPHNTNLYRELRKAKTKGERAAQASK